MGPHCADAQSVHRGIRIFSAYVPNGKDLIIPDLKGRVTVLNEKYELICQLGDNPNPALRAKHGATRGEWADGYFTAPHGAAADADGNVYVVDWNYLGRITRLERIPSEEPGGESK